jgi:hypothetical protein
MKSKLMIIVMYVGVASLVSLVIDLIIGSERELAERIGRALFMGLILGGVFFFLSQKKHDRPR